MTLDLRLDRLEQRLARLEGMQGMMNPTYHFARMRDLLNEFEPSRERSLAATKLDEAEMWLARCTPTAEAESRDQTGLAATTQQGKDSSHATSTEPEGEGSPYEAPLPEAGLPDGG